MPPLTQFNKGVKLKIGDRMFPIPKKPSFSSKNFGLDSFIIYKENHINIKSRWDSQKENMKKSHLFSPRKKKMLLYRNFSIFLQNSINSDIYNIYIYFKEKVY